MKTEYDLAHEAYCTPQPDLDNSSCNSMVSSQSKDCVIEAIAIAISNDRNTRATPDVPELKAELYDMRQERDRALEWRDHDKERAEAAEAKLARIKAQEPVGWVTDRIKTASIEQCFLNRRMKSPYINPVYAAPVASEAGTIERFRTALQMIEAGHGCPSALARHALSGKEPS